jgi:hypothetical protein
VVMSFFMILLLRLRSPSGFLVVESVSTMEKT